MATRKSKRNPKSLKEEKEVKEPCVTLTKAKRHEGMKEYW
jgi:hypothetical protein